MKKRPSHICLLAVATILFSFLFVWIYPFFGNGNSLHCTKDSLIEQKRIERLNPISLSEEESPSANLSLVMSEWKAYEFPRFFDVEISSNSGFVGQRKWMIGLLFAAELYDRTVILQKFAHAAYTTDYFLPFDRVIDRDYLNSQFLPSFRVAIDKPALKSKKATSLGALASNEPFLTLSIDAVKTDDKIFTSFPSLPIERARELRKKIFLSFRTSSWIRNLADLLLSQFMNQTGAASFTCIHLRIEDDFAAYFKEPPGYYSLQQIIEKINLTNWTGLKRSLFVAGNHAESVLETLRQTKLFDHVFSKDDLLPTHHPLRYKPGMPETLSSALDYEICSKAESFIGNNHSYWSEGMFDLFVYRNCTSCAMQVNEILDPIPKETTPLHPFCGRISKLYHGLDCVYVRKIF